MAKNRRSRSQKSSGKGSDSASRDSSPPSSAPAPGISSDLEGKPQAESTGDEVTLAQNAETSQGDSSSQDHVVSQATEAPGLPDNGPLNSPQIEPALSAIVEDPANDRSAEDFQSPTNTEQSHLTNSEDSHNSSPSSPTSRSMRNLADDLGDHIMDSSEEDTQGEQPNQSTPRRESLGADPEQGNPSENQGDVVGSGDVRSGPTRELQEEQRQRLAAEERVKALEEKVAAEKKKFKRELEKTHQAIEANKVRYGEKFNENDEKVKGLQAEVEEYKNKSERLGDLLAECEKAAAGDAARVKVEQDMEMRDAILREINSTAEAPLASPRDYLRPGSARFLLAEHEYLLDKFSPLYSALRNAANYADGRGEWTSDEKQLFDAFGGALQEMNDRLKEDLDREISQEDSKTPQNCLEEARTIWGNIAQAKTW